MIEVQRIPSPTLGDDIRIRVIRPDAANELPVVYLLHGRGDSIDSWAPALPDLQALPVIAVLVDAPWSDRAGYYVDSQYDGGRAIETALVRDLVGAVDAHLPVRRGRSARIVAGYSMGGFGSLRLGLAHPDLFGAVVALSPAAYVPEPPLGSSARESGAFGRGRALFDRARFDEVNYPAALAAFPSGQPLDVTIAAGDAEPPHPDAPATLAMLPQSRELAAGVRRVPGMAVTYRVYPGGHDFSVWRPALRDALASLLTNEV